MASSDPCPKFQTALALAWNHQTVGGGGLLPHEGSSTCDPWGHLRIRPDLTCTECNLGQDSHQDQPWVGMQRTCTPVVLEDRAPVNVERDLVSYHAI
jgi:hypothetical protein